MNIPNYITLLRVVLIPFFICLMIYHFYREALLVFIVAGVTDALDGMIARLTKRKTELGAFLDPAADKLLILSAFMTLVFIGRLPVWLVVIVVSRDVILSLGSMIVYFMTHSLKIEPSFSGKLTTVMQLGTVALSLVLMSYGRESNRGVNILYLLTAAITIVSGGQYIIKGIRKIG